MSIPMEKEEIQEYDFTIRPSFPKRSHPIDTGRYLFSTNEINKLYDKLKKSLQNRFPGVIIYGRPRLGKTRAINYIRRILPDDFGNLPIFTLLCRDHAKANEDVFFTEILRDIGHGLSSTGKTTIKRERLIKYLVEKADASGQNRIVFFIDDAQRLFDIQYNWLMDISNELDKAGVSLTSFLFGQSELANKRSVFILEEKHQIIGRFMVHQHPFYGVRTIEDLKECLISYDEESIYPLNSGWSFTRCFYPKAFINGFRLQNYSENLYEVFSHMRHEAGIRKPFEIPMQYITLTIEYILREFGIEGKNLEILSWQEWQEAIESSGYIEAEINQNVVEVDPE